MKYITYKNLIIGSFGFVFLLTSCNSSNSKADAYGNFEVEEIIVSAEGNGRIVELNINEGDILTANNQIGIIDTVMLSLNKNEIYAGLEAVSAQKVQLAKSLEVVTSKQKILQKEVDRVEQLHKKGAVTQQKYDEIIGQMEILKSEKSQVETQSLAIKAEESSLMAKISLLEEQLKRCKIVSPISGTVLQKYANQGEMIAIGRPIFKVGKIDNLILRAYISGSQLSEIKIGNEVSVKFDSENGADELTKGKVTWISSSAEFTPKIIQTKEERVNLVYAIKILVENKDGKLKIGMPGEVIFNN